MKLDKLKRMREIPRILDATLGLAIHMIIYAIYIYLIVLIKLSLSTIVLRIVLWRKKLPRNLRSSIIEMYEDKIIEILHVGNILSNILWNNPRPARLYKE